VANLFERLDKGRPRQTEGAIEQHGDLKDILRNVLTRPNNPKSSPIEKLLDWLVNHWAKNTISAREIYTQGPNCVRNKKKALRLAGILVEHGWLIPIETSRRNKQEWQIVRKSS
jgi:transposase